MGEWLKENNAPTKLINKYLKLRFKNNIDITARDLITDNYFNDLIKFIQKMYGEDVEFLNSKESWVKQRNKTFGTCAWEDDADKECLHHNKPTKRYWALCKKEDGFVQIWSKGRCYSGWNGNQWEDLDDNYTHNDIVRWDEVRRSMTEQVSDSEVLQHIKKSLSRMMKRKDNIVLKEGVGKSAVHKWNDWAWVTEMSLYVKATNSKNRLEGDIENGWKYTKVRSRMSHGHEIADFIWTPEEQIIDYSVKMNKEYYYNVDSDSLSYFKFECKDDALKFINCLAKAHADCNGYLSSRKHVGLETIPSKEFSIKTYSQNISLKGIIDPDDYLTPQAVMKMWRRASPDVLAEHRDKFESVPNYNIIKEVVEE